MSTASELAQLSPLAAEYGPFFFALLFTLVVPLIGQKLIGPNTRDETARLYRKVGIWLSVFLVIFSVVWWAAIQIWPPAASKTAIDNRVREVFKTKIRQGMILGVDDDDTFFVRQDPNSKYQVYLHPRRDLREMQISYIVVPTDEAITDTTTPDDPIFVQYGNFQSMKAMSTIGRGYPFIELPLCLKSQVKLVKGGDPSAQPKFDVTCEKPR